MRVASVVGPLIAIGTVLAGLVACSSDPTPTSASDSGVASDSGISDAGPLLTDASTCKLLKPYSSKDTVCNACAEAHCCAPINTCLTDSACDDTYVNCIIGCALDFKPDTGTDAGGVEMACIAQCGIDSPTGKVEYDAFSTCVDSECPTDCTN